MPVVADTGLPANPNVGDLINETRRQLMGMHRGEFNRLSNSVAATDGTVTCDFELLGIVRGGYISIDDEMMYVWSTNPVSHVVTVQRAQLGTTAATHGPGSIVEVNPRFPKVAIRKALKDEVRSWGPQLFRVVTADLSVTTSSSNLQTQNAYDLSGLPGDFYYVLDVRHSPRTYGWIWNRIPAFEVRRNLPTAQVTLPDGTTTPGFASGNALFLQQRLDSGSIRVIAGAPFVTTFFDDSQDLIAALGMAQTQLDIAPIGAAWRLLSSRESKRTFTESQAEPRKATEVPTEDIIRVSMALKAQRDGRLSDEMLRLRAEYPYRNRGT